MRNTAIADFDGNSRAAQLLEEASGAKGVMSSPSLLLVASR
jgi:hypothetical protein